MFREVAVAAAGVHEGLGMTEETTAARPPAGWLLDSTTGQTRWWDGARWTEHVKPHELEVPPTRASLRAAAQAETVGAPAPRAEHATVAASPQAEPPLAWTAPGGQFSYSPTIGYAAPTTASVPAQYVARPLTSKNGPAKASLILILLLVLGASGIVWLVSGRDPALMMMLGLLNIAMVLAAFVLAIVGLSIAVRRPTKKRESVFALVVSSLMLAYLLLQVALAFTVPSVGW